MLISLEISSCFAQNLLFKLDWLITLLFGNDRSHHVERRHWLVDEYRTDKWWLWTDLFDISPGPRPPLPCKVNPPRVWDTYLIHAVKKYGNDLTILWSPFIISNEESPGRLFADAYVEMKYKRSSLSTGLNFSAFVASTTQGDFVKPCQMKF